jgi:hypothetical protein
MNSSISGYSVLCSFYAANAIDSTSDDGIRYSSIPRAAVSAPNHLLHIPADKSICPPQEKTVRYLFSATADLTYALKSDIVLVSGRHLDDLHTALILKCGGDLIRARIGAGEFF